MNFTSDKCCDVLSVVHLYFSEVARVFHAFRTSTSDFVAGNSNCLISVGETRDSHRHENSTDARFLVIAQADVEYLVSVNSPRYYAR